MKRPDVKLLISLALITVIIIIICVIYFFPKKEKEQIVFNDLPSTEVTYIIIPHRDRNNYLYKLLEELPKYLNYTHKNSKFEIVAVQQLDQGNYHLATSRNVALAWLYYVRKIDPNAGVIIHDVDTIPKLNVDYSLSPVNIVIASFLVIGGIRGRLGNFIKCNGYPNIMKGWGYEDMVLWTRMKRLANLKIKWWPDEVKEKYPGATAIGINLEWNMTDTNIVQSLSQRYWKKYNSHIKYIADNPDNKLHSKHNPQWYEEKHRIRNWCFFNTQNAFDLDTLQKISYKDGINRIKVSLIQKDNFLQKYVEKYQDDPCILAVSNITFNADTILEKLENIPELEWYNKSLSLTCTTDEHCGPNSKCVLNACILPDCPETLP